MKISPVGAEMLRTEERTGWRTDRQTERRTNIHDEANSRFPQVWESAQKWLESQISTSLSTVLMCVNMTEPDKEIPFNSGKPHTPCRFKNCTAANNTARVTSKYTGLFEMIVGVLTTCHKQYTWDSSMKLRRWIKKFSKFSFMMCGVE